MENDFKKKNRKHDLTISSDVLHGLFENGKSPLSEQFIRWKLWGNWANYIGESLGKNSEPVGYMRGTLYVWVKNSTWMQQMIFVLDMMKNNINAKLGIEYVRTIHLTLDRRSVPKDALVANEVKTNIQRILEADSGD